VAKFTLALCTPGTRNSAFSTRATQDAQVMPPTPMSKESGALLLAASSIGKTFVLHQKKRNRAQAQWQIAITLF
jgi:hypothetical protein